MSTASEGLPSRKETIYLWVAHRRLWFTGLMLVACLASIVHGTWLPYYLTTAAILVWTASGSVAFTHAEILQTDCIECMYHRPDDGAQRAQKYMRVLWFEHRRILRLLSVMVLLLVFASVSRWSFSLALAVYTGGFALGDLSEHLHHRLRPWCPWCQRRGGGDTHVCTPTPDPSMTKVN